MKNSIVQDYHWHMGAGIERTVKNSYQLEEGEGVGDGRAERSSAIGDGRQAAISFTPYVTRHTNAHSQLLTVVTSISIFQEKK